MLKLNLPQNVLNKEQYSSLSSLQKGEYIHNLLKEILEINPGGITISQVDNITHLGRSTVWHHLEILAARADCLKVERGDTDVYHSNKVLASLKELDIQGNYYYYAFHVVENTYGKFVRIQTKQENRSGSLATHSGVIITHHLMSEILNSLAKIKEHHLNENQ